MKFHEQVYKALGEIQEMLISKNEKYGNSALEPLGVFSKLSPEEGLMVRIDDKLKRIKNGSLDKDDEDVVNDLIGYLVLLKIHSNQQSAFDELDGSHNWEKIKQREELISIMRADEKDGLYTGTSANNWREIKEKQDLIKKMQAELRQELI